jgi:hypothetical protein
MLSLLLITTCVKCNYWIVRSTWALTSAVPLNVGTSPSFKENVAVDEANNCDEEIVGNRDRAVVACGPSIVAHAC